MWIGVTTNPTAHWLARQITEAFPWDSAPVYLLRDNDGAYGDVFTRRLRAMGIRDRPVTPRSPWQNGYVERVIGTIRRECLDHIIVWNMSHLQRVLNAYLDYYNSTRTHLGLSKDAPLHRPIQRRGRIIANEILGGLHHQYGQSSFWKGHGLNVSQSTTFGFGAGGWNIGVNGQVVMKIYKETKISAICGSNTGSWTWDGVPLEVSLTRLAADVSGSLAGWSRGRSEARWHDALR